MKKIYNLILLMTLCSTISLKAQVTTTDNSFLGTWEYQTTDNEIFRVVLELNSEYGDAIFGHYEKVLNNNGLEFYIYCSDKEKYVGNNKGWLPYVISLSGNNQSVSGTITDNTVDENLYDQLKSGRLTFEILSNNGTDPITARWTVKRGQGPYINEAPDFSVPTDITLTKVE